MHDLLIIFQGFLKLAAEFLVTFIACFICLIVREIYLSIKNRRELI